jgi:hypothetical protein
MRRLLVTAVAVALVAPVGAQDKSADIMNAARQALGGGLEKVTAISLEGPFRREMGNRQVQGTIILTLQLPDRMHRLEDTEMMGGMSIERVTVLAGDTAWEDMQNRGGMGGGMIVMRQGPPGQELNPEQAEQARLRRFRTELNRYLLAFLGGAGLSPAFAAVAEAPDGKADVLELRSEAGQAVRLFVDQQTRMPLMLQYQEVRPRVMIAGPGGPGGPGGRGGFGGRGGGGAPPPPPAGAGRAQGGGQRPDPGEVRRRIEAMPLPEPSNVTLYLDDFKRVDGVLLPTRLTQAVDGKTVEEWTIEKARVNPPIKASLFEKK